MRAQPWINQGTQILDSRAQRSVMVVSAKEHRNEREPQPQVGTSPQFLLLVREVIIPARVLPSFREGMVDVEGEQTGNNKLCSQPWGLSFSLFCLLMVVREKPPNLRLGQSLTKNRA